MYGSVVAQGDRDESAQASSLSPSQDSQQQGMARDVLINVTLILIYLHFTDDSNRPLSSRLRGPLRVNTNLDNGP